MKVLAMAPVFNQVHELPQVLAEIAELDLPCDEFLLVNNGCDDGSEELIRDSGHPSIGVERNRGVGWAILAAAEWGLEHGYDVLVVMASNGKMLPAEMHRVVEPILRGEADYVTGSRYLSGGASPNLPGFRKHAIPMVNRMVRVATGQRVTDATCGYRAFRLELAGGVAVDLRLGAVRVRQGALVPRQGPLDRGPDHHAVPGQGEALLEDPARGGLGEDDLPVLLGSPRAQRLLKISR